MTQRATVTKATIERTIKAVQSVGLPIAEVKVSPDGEVRVICHPEAEGDARGWDE